MRASKFSSPWFRKEQGCGDKCMASFSFRRTRFQNWINDIGSQKLPTLQFFGKRWRSGKVDPTHLCRVSCILGRRYSPGYQHGFLPLDNQGRGSSNISFSPVLVSWPIYLLTCWALYSPIITLVLFISSLESSAPHDNYPSVARSLEEYIFIYN